MPRTTFRDESLADRLARLGNVPLDRIAADPPPGTATKRDLLRKCAKTGRLFELVDGTLVEKPMGAPESHLAFEFGWHLRTYLEGNPIGYGYAPDALIEVLPKLVRGPDVCFVPWTRRPERTVGRKPISREIPELVVEVLSPSNTAAEIERKLKEYFLAGVLLAWVIDPRAEAAEAYTAPDVKTAVPPDGVLDGGDILPGFRVPLARLFAQMERPAKGKKPRKKA